MKEAGLNISKGANEAGVINLPSGAKFSIVDGWEKVLLELITIPSFIEYIMLITSEIDGQNQII